MHMYTVFSSDHPAGSAIRNAQPGLQKKKKNSIRSLTKVLGRFELPEQLQCTLAWILHDSGALLPGLTFFLQKTFPHLVLWWWCWTVLSDRQTFPMAVELGWDLVTVKTTAFEHNLLLTLKTAVRWNKNPQTSSWSYQPHLMTALGKRTHSVVMDMV